MNLMPCFKPSEACAEGIVIGRLLAGYGELELEMCACLIAVEGIFDVPIKALFGERGEKKRIQKAKKLLQPEFAKANLSGELMEALGDMDWCRQIRNQYSHCHWYWTSQDGLCFVNLEELAKQPTAVTKLTTNRHAVDVALLEKQEEYFWYVKQCFMHLADAYKAWDQARARGGAVRRQILVYLRPSKLARPPTHN